MNSTWYVALAGCVAGMAGTGLGGIMALWGKKTQKDSLLLGGTAGMMLAVALLHMLPGAAGDSGWGPALRWAFTGAALVAILSPLLLIWQRKKEGSSYRSTGILMAAGVALHNLPEGLALGAGLHHPVFGVTLALMIMVHDIPEGLAMALPLRWAGVKPGRIVLTAFLAGLPTAIGAVAGALIGAVSPRLLSGMVALGAGAMLWLTWGELIPQAWKKEKGWAALGAAVGFGIGAGALLLMQGI